MLLFYTDLGGFIKIHLRSLHKDDIALLKGRRAFVMEMEDDEERIDKVEKGFELITKARILYLHLKGDTLLGQPCTHHIPRDSHGELLQTCNNLRVLDIDETQNP
jgi:hypothetical protein